MKAIKYVTDSKGKCCALLIDLVETKKAFKTKKGIIELMEDIEDIIIVELSRDGKSIPYKRARKQIFKSGI